MYYLRETIERRMKTMMMMPMRNVRIFCKHFKLPLLLLNSVYYEVCSPPEHILAATVGTAAAEREYIN